MPASFIQPGRIRECRDKGQDAVVCIGMMVAGQGPYLGAAGPSRLVMISHKPWGQSYGLAISGWLDRMSINTARNCAARDACDGWADMLDGDERRLAEAIVPLLCRAPKALSALR